MTTDARDARSLPEEGFHEIQLSGKQLVFLFMATTIVSVVIFLCGVLVGRGARTESTDASRVPVSVPEAPIEAGSVSPFSGSPVREAVQSNTASSEPPAGSAAAQQLMADQPPPESVTPVDEAAAPKPDPAPAVARAPSPSPPADRGGWVVQVTALRQKPEAEAIANRLSSRGYKAFVLDPQPGSTPLYRVRVGPFSDRSDAEQTVKRLSREEQFNPWISR
jgi:cell division septation protein DedD